MLGRDKTIVKRTNKKKVLNGEETQSRAFLGGQKNWRMAVVIYWSSIEATWEGIKEGFSRKLDRNVELGVLHANKAILWCRNEEEKRVMLRSKFCKLYTSESVKVVRWTQQEHWEDIIFEGQNTWVGIEEFH